MAALVIDRSELYPKEDERPLPPLVGAPVSEWRRHHDLLRRLGLPGPIKKPRIAKVKIVWEPPPKKPKAIPRPVKSNSDGDEPIEFYHPRPMSPRAIIHEVAFDYGLEVTDITGPRRTLPITTARFEAMYRLRVEKRFSMPRIGRLLGGRDHSSVLNGIRRHCEDNGLDMPVVGRK